MSVHAHHSIAADAEGWVREATALELAGNIGQAEELYRKALNACRGSGLQPERAACIDLAKLCADYGREFEALALSRRAATLSVTAGDAWGLVLSRLHVNERLL